MHTTYNIRALSCVFLTDVVFRLVYSMSFDEAVLSCHFYTVVVWWNSAEPDKIDRMYFAYTLYYILVFIS